MCFFYLVKTAFFDVSKSVSWVEWVKVEGYIYAQILLRNVALASQTELWRRISSSRPGGQGSHEMPPAA